MHLARRLAILGTALLTLASCRNDPAEPEGTPSADRATYSPGDTLFVSIAAGGRHTCALSAGGRAFCWGADFDGQIGSPSVSATCGGAACAVRPVAVAGGFRFRQLAATWGTSCGLTPSGRAYCWGGGSHLTGPESAPTLVAGPPALRAIRAADDLRDRVCGLAEDGRAWCWNVRAVTLNGPEVERAHEVPRGLRFAELGTSCGLTQVRAVYCWDGTVDTTVFDPESVVLDSCAVGGGRNYTVYLPCSASPVRLRGGSSFTRLSDDKRDCAVDAAGAAYCWGSGPYPNFWPDPPATGGRGPTRVPFPVPVTRLLGGIAALCGQTAAGDLYCRGNNDAGQFGAGANQVPSDAWTHAGGGMRFATVSATNYHMCGLTTDGAAFCWGPDALGELGSDRTARDVCHAYTGGPAYRCSFTPVRVASIAGTR